MTDRFGNTVDYSYDTAGKLTRIASNDGRTLTLYWTTYGSSPVVDHVTDGVRTWTYGYGNNELATVTRPDGSQWHFSLAAVAAVKPGAINPAPLGLVGSITTPYGLSGTFTLDLIDQGWAAVPVYPEPVYFPTASIVSKQISGAGVPLQTWNYRYNGGGGWWVATPPGTETKSIDVIDPMGVRTRSTYNVNFDWREGQLEKVEVFPAGSSTPIRTTTNSYIQIPQIGQSTIAIGLSVNGGRFGEPRRMTSTVTQVSGDSFTTQIDLVDAYKNPTQMSTSNSLGSVVRTTTMSYQNNSAGSPWVIGTMTGMSINGTQVSQTTLNAQLQPEDRYAFGLLRSSSDYYLNGLLHGQRDGLGHRSVLSDYYRGKPRTMTRPDSTALTMTVNPTGTVASMTDARGNTTSMGYDALNRPASIQYPSGDTVAWASGSTVYATLTATELGMPVGTFRARSTLGRLQTSTYYDAMLRPLLVEEKDTTTGVVKYSRTTYDPMGHVSFKSYPSATPDALSGIVSTYDALGRLTRTATSDGVTLQTLAYLSGNRMRVSDAGGNATTTAYQAFGMAEYQRPTLIQAPGQTTTLNRNLFGEITSVNQGGVIQTSLYDSYHRLCKKIEPETGQTVMAYDADSKPVWSVKGFAGDPAACDNGTFPANAVRYSYDVLDQMTAVDYADSSGDVSLSYDLDGHLTTASNPTATWTYTYNKRGLMETEQAVIDGKTFIIDPVYNVLGLLSTLKYPDGRNYAYAPDAFGRPTQVSSFATGVQYFPNGLASSYTLGNGLSVDTTLNARQFPDTVQVLQGATPLQKLTYGYNDDADITSITDGVDGSDSATLGYDGLHRLTTANGLWGSYTYVYSTRNNLSSRTGSNPLTYAYNGTTNRLTSVTGSVSRAYGYDALGRVTGDGVQTYTWNDADQLTAIPGIATYGYDANNKRIKTVKANGSVEYALYDAEDQLLYTEKGPTRTNYLYLNGQPLLEAVNGGAGTYLHPDLLGSPRMATNGSPTILWREHYAPYGEKLNGVQDKIGYTGHAFDSESGLTYAQARYYDAAIGRFLSTDPIGFQDSDPFTFNRYAYGNNNPYKYTDPTGMCPLCLAAVPFVAGALIGGGVELGRQVSSGAPISIKGVAAAAVKGGAITTAAAAGAVLAVATSGAAVPSIVGAVAASTGASLGTAAATLTIAPAVDAVMNGGMAPTSIYETDAKNGMIAAAITAPIEMLAGAVAGSTAANSFTDTAMSSSARESAEQAVSTPSTLASGGVGAAIESSLSGNSGKPAAPPPTCRSANSSGKC